MNLEKLLLALSVVSGRVGIDALSDENYATLEISADDLGGDADALLELCEAIVAEAIMPSEASQAVTAVENEL